MARVPLRAGVIGLGVGMRHLATYESDARCEVVALCDIDEERLHETARTHPRCRATVDAMDVLNDPDIDIVSIASYDSDHGGHVVAAIRAGKHVFVEKPLCLHDEEFERIDAALRRHPEVQLSSNLLLRCAPRFVAAKTRIAAGAMGRVFYLEGDYNYGRLEKITDGWRGRLPFYSVTHGGAIHMIDLVLWLSGGRVREVVAAGNRIATTGSRFRHDDMVTALLRFEDGATAKVSANFGCVCPHSHAVAVYGTGGSFFASLQGTVFYGSRDPKVPPEAVDAAEDVEFRDGVQRAFIRQILEGVPGVVVARDVLDAMAVSLAVERSLTSGRWEPVRYVMAGASTAAGAAADYQ